MQAVIALGKQLQAEARAAELESYETKRREDT
jgi:hypothetical protein